MSADGVFEDLVETLSQAFEEITGKKLSMMRKGKICAELFWANSQKK